MRKRAEKLGSVLLTLTAVIMGVILFVRMTAQQPTLSAEVAGLTPLGSTIPSIKVVTLAGDTLDLNAETEGLIVFVSPTCVYCKADMPILREALEATCDIPLLLVISAPPPDAKGFWRQNGWEPKCREVEVASIARPGTVTDLLGVNTVPMHLWRDSEGRIAGWKAGLLRAGGWRAAFGVSDP